MNDVDNELVEEIFNRLGYDVFINNRKKLSKHRSGGILIACKQNLKENCIPCKTQSQYVEWIRIKKQATGHDSDLLLGTVYIPPRQSIYSNIEIFQKLEIELSHIKEENEYVLLCGDFNSHTGTCNDLVNIDYVHNIGDDEIVTDTNIIIEKCNGSIDRANSDKCRNDVYGNKLIDLCKLTNLCFYNGRIGSDKGIGMPTTVKGTVVDYFIGSPLLLMYVKDLYVDKFDPVFSDIHNKMVLVLETTSVHVNNLSNIESFVSENSSQQNIRRWDKNKSNLFSDNLGNNEIQTLTDDIVNGKDLSVQVVNEKLKSIMLDSARKTLGYKKNVKKRKCIKMDLTKSVN